MIATDQLLILQCSEKAHSYLDIGPAVCQCDAVPNCLSTGMIGSCNGDSDGNVVVDSSMDSLKVEPDACDDGEVTGIKVEEVTIKEEGFTVTEEDFAVVKEEEDPLLIRVPLIERECEVSFLSVCPFSSVGF